MRVITAGFHLSDCSFPRHRHTHWELVYQREGRVITEQDGTPVDMSPGMLLLHAPEVEHGDIADGRYCIVYVGIASEEPLDWPRQSFDDCYRRIGNLVEAMAHESHGVEQPENELLQLMLRQLDIQMSRKTREAESSSIDRKMGQAKSILTADLEGKVDLDWLASELGMGRSSFFAHFTERFRTPPQEYQRNLRIQRAISMLRNSDFTLQTIAERCGYSSASHLSRHVKQVTGRRPGELRNVWS